MKYYLIAGEASGDLHGANLMKEIKQRDSEASFRFWGGDLMAKQGGRPIKHIRDLAFMGFVEVLLNIRTIIKNLAFCKKDIAFFNPDMMIFIDYPEFNLRISKFTHRLGIKNYYYISPQLWAWKSSRINIIKQTINRMFVVLPFEKEFYAKRDYKVSFVGHPLVDAIKTKIFDSKSEFYQKHQLSKLPIIALLPGSRKQEIRVMLQIMIFVVDSFPKFQFVIAGAPSQDLIFYKKLIANHRIPVVMKDTYNLLKHSHAALVTSGTATLETALLDIPQVVCYKGNWLSYIIGKWLVKVDYISLVNLILKKRVVAELIQAELNVENLKKELYAILLEKNRKKIKKDYAHLKKLLGERASSQVAEYILHPLMR